MKRDDALTGPFVQNGLFFVCATATYLPIGLWNTCLPGCLLAQLAGISRDYSLFLVRKPTRYCEATGNEPTRLHGSAETDPAKVRPGKLIGSSPSCGVSYWPGGSLGTSKQFDVSAMADKMQLTIGRLQREYNRQLLAKLATGTNGFFTLLFWPARPSTIADRLHKPSQTLWDY
jgi:hypothetical protein